MENTFVVIRTECCNPNMNAPVRIVLQQVKDGVLLPQNNFFINHGDAIFDFTTTGLTHNFCSTQPLFPEVWKEIEPILLEYSLIVCSGFGYSIHVLKNTLARYNMDCGPYPFVSAANLCKIGINSISYSLPWLSSEHPVSPYHEGVPSEEARTWAELINISFNNSPSEDVYSFCENGHLNIGLVGANIYEKSYIHREYHRSYVTRKKDPLVVDVHPDENCPFCGANVVFTGKLTTMKRDDAQKKVLEIGGLCPNGVSSKVNFLVVGEQDLRVVGADGLSGKMKKAYDLKQKGADIEIISENDFLAMF